MKKLLTAVALIGSAFIANGQITEPQQPLDSNKTYRIEVADGSVFIGNVLWSDSIIVRIRTNTIPSFDVPVSGIKSIKEIAAENIREGTYWFPNPNPTRYLFAPSAFNLKPNEGYFQNTYLVLQSVNVGITEHVSIGGSTEILSLFGSGDIPVFLITPKIGYELGPKFAAGGGLLYVNYPTYDYPKNKRGSAGIAYALGTYGDEENNITCGMGWGFIEEEFEELPFVTLCAMARMTKRAAFVTENWYVPILDPDFSKVYLSYGLRFFGEKIAVDLAFVNSYDIFINVIPIGIPYVDFVVQF